MADTEGLGANQNLFIFECNSETYMGCMEHQLFGSNKPWPLQVKFGDYLLLHHIEAGALFGLWKAASDGKQNIVPKAWGRRFPYQVRIQSVTAKPVEIPKALIEELKVDLSIGQENHVADSDVAERLINACNS
jgi:hypothetical protein